MTELEAKVEMIGRKLDQLVVAIIGDPTDETKPGVMIRLDRLEQSEKLRNKIVWLMGSGILFTIGTTLFSFIT